MKNISLLLLLVFLQSTLFAQSAYLRLNQLGETPIHVHTSVWALSKRVIPGGLIDGPVYAAIFQSLRGLTLTQPDEFAEVQNRYVVYHDDIGDYSTNEPTTMDGTAGAILLMAHWAREKP